MVFRDYVQGAYRMRGIGKGQTLNCFIIPEVATLMQKSLNQPKMLSSVKTLKETLISVVSWLIINSMNSEKIQWSMLCVQNISNIYRKNAYNCMQIKSAVNKNIGYTSGAIDKTFAKSTLYLNKIVSLDESRGLNIF